ncbi:MAG: type II secretion system ATPase GspE [Candidatus Omnitrophota bacterium]
MMTRKSKRSLGESLVEDGLITPEQFKAAQSEESKTGHRLRKIIVKMGMVTEEDMVEFISRKLGVPKIELSNYLIDPQTVELVPENLARKYELIPVFKIGSRLTCAMVDPWNVFALDELRMKTNLTVEPAAAQEPEILKALDEYYGAKGTIEDVIKSMDEKDMNLGDPSGTGAVDIKKLEDMVEEPVVIKLVNLIIMKAVHEVASDIHIEPEEETLKIRIRVDGMLHEITSPPKHMQSAVISRLKIMANLDIAERRMPQDGRFNVKMEGKDVDVRVSCVPTIYGENVVLRLLDASSALLSLKDIGFANEILDRYLKLITRPYGIILVTGPTGSGKTTTLYASLDKINTIEKNIITIEDPVEYRLAGIRQIQVNPKVNLTFANGLRSMLRQDPDIMMVGEIRDFETAEIAIQAALTGHLVFSTLHTNDAPSAITRLVDMGTEPFLVSASVIGVLAQRLIRTICGECKEEYEPPDEVLKDLGINEASRIKFYRGKGCPKCVQTGYKGRLAIFELMLMDESVRGLITAKAPLEEISKRVRSSGMLTLKEDGINKIRDGVTTVEEVLRVTREG